MAVRSTTVRAYRDQTHPGLRLNWANLFTFVLGMLWTLVVGFVLYKHKVDSSAWWGVLFVLIGLAVWRVYWVTQRSSDHRQKLPTGIVIGIVMTVLLWAFDRLAGDHATGQALLGALGTATGLALGSYNVLTTWWKHDPDADPNNPNN